MKKILHLTISSEIGGGPEHIYQLIKGTSKYYESHVACPKKGEYFQKFNELVSERITLLPHRKFKILFLFKLYRYINKNKIEILHGHGIGAGVYCRILSIFIKIPVVHTPHGINQKIEIGLMNKIYIYIENLLSSYITAIVYVSETESTYSKKIGIWKNVFSKVINNGTKCINPDDKYKYRNSIREELHLESQKVVITASRYDYQKNTIEYCKIASLIPEYVFLILGEGTLKNKCEEYCLKNNINNVFFLGNVLNPINYFAASDIYLSTSRWEGLSMAILEAMSVGLPVVASEVIGNVDLVESNKTGFLYKLGDVKDAVKKINKITENEFFTDFSQNAIIKHNLNFSAESMCNSTLNLYNQILK